MQSKVVLTATLVSPGTPQVYRPLGAFRFGLAMLVMAQHFQHLLPVALRAVFDRTGFGAIAVGVFFAVSGFVVAEAHAGPYAGRPGAFLYNRLLRLVPPYLAALLLAIGIHAALWHAGVLVLWDYPHAGPPVTLARIGAGLAGLVPGLQGRLGDDFEFIPFAWSLRMEMAFYLAVTLAVSAGRAGMTGALGTALAGSAAFLLHGRPGLLSCAPMFLVGAAFSLCLKSPNPARIVYLLAVLPVAACGFASWGQHGHPVLPVQFLLLSLLLVLSALLAASAASQRWRPLDRRLGDLSYPLYLNHYGVGVLGASLGGTPGLALYAISAVGAVLLAVLMEAVAGSSFKAVRDRIRSIAPPVLNAVPVRAKRTGWGEPASPPSPG